MVDIGCTVYLPKYIRSRGTALSMVTCAAGAPGPDGIFPGAAGAGAGADLVSPTDLVSPIVVPPPAIAALMSSLLMRPPAPVPEIVLRSILLSRARRRTSGELWTRFPLF